MSEQEQFVVEQKSTVKISRNAKGESQPEIKVVSGETADELERIRVLAIRAYVATVEQTGGLVGGNRPA